MPPKQKGVKMDIGSFLGDHASRNQLMDMPRERE
jgi:hypothetical protein